MKFPWQKKSVPDNPVAVNSNAPGNSYTYSCKVYGLSETGPTRGSNEDSVLFFYPGYNQQTLFALVADGMGGHNAGEVASNMACGSAKEFILTHYLQTDVKKMLEEMIQQMHQHIRTAAEENPAYNGMGTTATSVFIRDGYIYYVHVGDSRLYHFANNVLSQLSTDQTLVNDMVKDGKLTKEEAEHHDMKHVLMQALGTVENIKPEVSPAGSVIHKGEYYFLCSDGIHDAMSEEELQSLLSMKEPAFIMESIKALCYRRQARDNFSALLVEITEEQPAVNSVITREQNVMV
ncbi:MAG: protein phosphatase 2C domain-containing protein [Bacteroidota bacterium]